MADKKKPASRGTAKSGKAPRRKNPARPAQPASAIYNGEDAYRFLVENISDVVWRISPDLIFVYISPSDESQRGYKPEEVIGRSIFDFMTPGSAEQVHIQAVARQAALKQGERLERMVYEIEQRCKDGRAIWTEVISNPTYNAAGALTGFQGITRDITTRKYAEEARHASEERLHLAMQASRQGWFELNVQTGEAIVSDEYVRILGYEPAAFTASMQSWSNGIHPEDRDAVLQAFRDGVSSGATKTMEYRRQAKDGSWKWLRSVGKVTGYDAEGKPLRMIGTHADISEQKQAEETLKKNEERFQLAMQGANDGLWDWDLSTDVVYYSPRWKAMLGYAENELEDNLDTWKHLVHPDDRERTLNLVRSLLEGRTDKFEVEFRMRHKDGGIRHILSRAFLAASTGGGHRRLVGTHVDITDRKLAEVALQESRKQYHQLFAEMTSGLLVFEVIFDGSGSPCDYRLTNANPACDRLIGMPMQEKIGETGKNLPFGWAPERLQLFYQVAIAGKPLQYDRYNETLHRHYETYVFSPRQGQFAHLFQDITERKKAEEKIRQNEEFIRSILDTVDEGFIVVDREYRILTANKAYCSQVGHAGSGIIGRRCYEVSHRINRPCHEEGEDCSVRHVFATGKPYSVLHKHLDADGHVLFVETKGFPIKDTAGNVTSVIETINNITEKHLLEEERLKTQKLESIGTLAGGIAHDFNNLLQGIFGYISMAKITFDQRDRSLAMLEQAEKALHQSVNLTTQLLTFSKGGKPVKKPVSLRPIIDNAAKFALSGSRSDYVLDIKPSLWSVNGDAGQLGQVIQNIVLNADQAMPLGGIVRISVRNAAAGDHALPHMLAHGNYVEIVIKDNGIGIPEQYLGKIFDPYFTTKEKGSGLGLATSYSIIRNHDGQIQVSSGVGKGAEFHIYLPALATEQAADDTGPATSAPAAPARPRARILVMDDEDIIRDLSTLLLNELGNDVEVAPHGEAALEKYSAAAAAGKPFDLVILDLTIRGGMGGMDTIRKLQEIDPQVNAIVSSGYSDDAAIANFREYGFKAFLKKPYNIQELQAVLHALLGT